MVPIEQKDWTEEDRASKLGQNHPLDSAKRLFRIRIISRPVPEARIRAIGITVIVVSFLAVVCIVLGYQRNQNQIDQMLGMPADTW